MGEWPGFVAFLAAARLPLLPELLKGFPRNAEGIAPAGCDQRAFRDGPANRALVDTQPGRRFDRGKSVSVCCVVRLRARVLWHA